MLPANELRLASFIAPHPPCGVQDQYASAGSGLADRYARSFSPETGYDLASSLIREFSDVDGIYMPCNKWRTISVIDRIERQFGKPVVTNTQAWVWEALRGMGMMKPIQGYGRLLSNPALTEEKD